MSPLLATRNSCELLASFSDCLTDWGVDWWRGRGCLCVALLLGNGRVDTVAGGWVWVLWASCEVLTALGGSGSLPITDPDPDAANKIKYCSSWNVPPSSSTRLIFFFNVYLSKLEKKSINICSNISFFFFFFEKVKQIFKHVSSRYFETRFLSKLPLTEIELN